MTCGGCAINVEQAILTVPGASNVTVDHLTGKAEFSCAENEVESIKIAIRASGFTVGKETDSGGVDWKCRATWRESAHNTKWCLIGCSIGEFATLGYYQYAGWPLTVPPDTALFALLLALPLINGLITSIILETIILVKNGMVFSASLRTALGMSFISMLAMEIAMVVTDILLTGGMGMTWWVIPPMLVMGFITPWPYNYWRLKKYGKACH